MNPAPETLKKTTPFEASPRQESRGRHRRFFYACGAKPLDGYTIKRGIGIGGFGEVYFAVSDAGKEVALKRIERNFEIEMRGVIHCLNLKHVNLISLFDVRIDSQGTGWVVMEYVPGESLKDAIDSKATGLDWEPIQFWFRGMAEGVRYLHDRGIVHRDLKPGNIFRDSDADVVKIGDYGLSKLISAGNPGSQTETVGTFHYMAPEVGRGSYGKEVDLYALGIILYEMLTGTVPFDGETSQEIVMKHLTMDPDLARIPSSFVPLVRGLLQKDPTRRCKDALEMKRWFDEALSQRSRPSAIELPTQNRGQSEPPMNLGRQPSKELVYITEESLVIPDGADMVFGEVVEVVTAESIEKESGFAEPDSREAEGLSRNGQTSSPNGQREGRANSDPVEAEDSKQEMTSPRDLSDGRTAILEKGKRESGDGGKASEGHSLVEAPPVRRWKRWFPPGERARRIEILTTLAMAMPLLALAPAEFRWLAFPILMVPVAFEWMRLGQLGDAGRQLHAIGDELESPTQRLKVWHRWGVALGVIAGSLTVAVGSRLLGHERADAWVNWAWLTTFLAGLSGLWLFRQTGVSRSKTSSLRWLACAAVFGLFCTWLARELHAGWYSDEMAAALDLSGWSGLVSREWLLGALLSTGVMWVLEQERRKRQVGSGRFLGLVIVQSMAFGFILDFFLWMPWGWGAMLVGVLVVTPITLPVLSETLPDPPKARFSRKAVRAA